MLLSLLNRFKKYAAVEDFIWICLQVAVTITLTAVFVIFLQKNVDFIT